MKFMHKNMGSFDRKTNKFRFILYILMAVLLVRIIIWLEPGQLKKIMSSAVSKKAEEFVVYVMQNSNVKVAYAMEDNSDAVEKLAKSINHSSSVYSYVENNYSAQDLVIYDPNTYQTNPVMLAENEEQEGEKEDGSVEGGQETENNGEETAETTAEQPTEGNVEGEGTTAEQQTEAPQTQEIFSPMFSMEQLKDYNFLRSNLYIVPERASVLPTDLNAEELLSMDMSIVKDASVPQILIYHTHGSEGFTNSTEDIKGTGIIAAGSRLAEILSSVYGYNVIHCTEIFDNVNGVFDRSKAYDYSRETVQQILTDNPSIQVTIDLHRDGVNENTHLVTDVNGKPTSKIMFFNGVSRSSAKGDIEYLYNRYRSENLSFSLQAKLEALGKYPDFTRKNYIDAYQYNLDLLPRAMLIEAGAQTNSLEEELNAMEPLADILDSVLSGKSREHLGLVPN